VEPGYFIIAILGCADGSAQCTPVATVPTHYDSAAACSTAAPEVLVNNSNFDFPSLVAECRPVAAPAAASKDLPHPEPADTMRS
jgi:acyl-CoA synthetase (AMP-forming)/AMP-acid ligase II